MPGPLQIEKGEAPLYSVPTVRARRGLSIRAIYKVWLWAIYPGHQRVGAEEAEREKGRG